MGGGSKLPFLGKTLPKFSPGLLLIQSQLFLLIPGDSFCSCWWGYSPVPNAPKPQGPQSPSPSLSPTAGDSQSSTAKQRGTAQGKTLSLVFFFLFMCFCVCFIVCYNISHDCYNILDIILVNGFTSVHSTVTR